MKPIAVVVFAVVVSASAACQQQPSPPSLPLCDATSTSTARQPLQRIPAILGIVLDDELGGRTCLDAGCVQNPEICVGALSAVSGTSTTVVIDLEGQGAAGVSVQGIAIEADCGWSVVDSGPFSIDAGTTVPVEVTFTAGDVGFCEADFVVNARADNVEEGQARVRLRATVTSAE